jgi:hypothetical protein
MSEKLGTFPGGKMPGALRIVSEELQYQSFSPDKLSQGGMQRPCQGICVK